MEFEQGFCHCFNHCKQEFIVGYIERKDDFLFVMPGIFLKGFFTIPKHADPTLLDDTQNTYFTKLQDATWMHFHEVDNNKVRVTKLNFRLHVMYGILEQNKSAVITEECKYSKSKLTPSQVSHDVFINVDTDGYVRIENGKVFQCWCIFKLPISVQSKIDTNVFKMKHSERIRSGLDESDIQKYKSRFFDEILFGGFCQATSFLGDCIIGYTKKENKLLFTLPGVVMSGTFTLPLITKSHTTKVDGEWEGFPYEKYLSIRYNTAHVKDFCDRTNNINVSLTDGLVNLFSDDILDSWCKFTHPFYKESKNKRRKHN